MDILPRLAAAANDWNLALRREPPSPRSVVRGGDSRRITLDVVNNNPFATVHYVYQVLAQSLEPAWAPEIFPRGRFSAPRGAYRDKASQVINMCPDV